MHAEFSKNPDTLTRALFICIGFAPIGSLCLSTFGVMPLSIGGPLFVGPALILAIFLCGSNSHYLRRGMQGLALGLLAVLIYDLTCRLPFILSGIWPDFIPKIGNYLLNQPKAHWSIGYLWRYLGNGGGMGLAFYMGFPLLKGRFDARPCGIVYGIGIFCCLLGTVYLSHAGTEYLFRPNLLTASAGLAGHIVYGSVLGFGTHWLGMRDGTGI